MHIFRLKLTLNHLHSLIFLKEGFKRSLLKLNKLRKIFFEEY